MAEGHRKGSKNVMPTFKFLEQDNKVPISYQHIDYHMIFDAKMDFTQKAQFIAGCDSHILCSCSMVDFFLDATCASLTP